MIIITTTTKSSKKPGVKIRAPSDNPPNQASFINRPRSRIRPEIGQEQYGFVKDTGTRNVTFIIRMISEKAIHMQEKCTLTSYRLHI